MFRIFQRDEESLEDYVESLNYNLRRSKYSNLDKNILKTIFIRGMKEDCLDMLNLMGKGGLSKESYDTIVELLFRSSRGSTGR